MVSNDLLKGTLKTIVLSLLEEKGRMYGYEITQEVERLTKGKIQLTWGALYPTLHKLEADHLITAEEVSIGRRVRKYYTLTESGTKSAREKVQEFLDFVTIMGQILNPKPSLNLG
jgi:DNA-binding PadR family transcriptional regulator